MAQEQVLRPRSRFMAAALSAALALGMAPAFSVAAESAYADDITAASVSSQVGVQDEGTAVISAEVIAEGNQDVVSGSYLNGVMIVLGSTDHDVSYVGDGDTVTLNGVTFDYSVNTKTNGANKFFVGGISSPYTIYLTNEAKLVEGENTLTVNAADLDCGNFTVTFDYAPATTSEQKAAGVEWDASFFNKGDDSFLGFYGVNLAPADGGSIDGDYRNAITGVTVGETAYSKASSAGSMSANNFVVSEHAITIGDAALSDGENTVTIKADGYEDVVLTIVYDGSAQTAFLKSGDEPQPPVQDQVLDVAWSVAYAADKYDSKYDKINLSASLPEGFRANSVVVNGAAHAAISEDDYGFVSPGKFDQADSGLSIGLDGFVDGANTVAISADGYEDATVTVYYNSALKMASLSEIVDKAADLANGDYKFGTKAITESSWDAAEQKEFDLSSQFDPNIKLTKSDDGLTMTLLYSNSIDMVKIALDGVEASKTPFGPGELGAYQFTVTVPELAQPHKLSFSYNTGMPNLGDNGVMTSSVYLTNYETAEWSGFDSVISFGTNQTEFLKGKVTVDRKTHETKAIPRIYTVPVTLMSSGDITKPAAMSPFGKVAQMIVDENGAATLRLTLNPTMNMYASDYKFSADTADYQDATIVEVAKADETGAPAVIDIAVPETAKAKDGVYVSMNVGGMGRILSGLFLKVDYPSFQVLQDADKKAVDAANKLLASLPSSDAVVLDDKGAIAKAREAYDNLTDAQKALVADEGPLNAAESQLAVCETSALIEALDENAGLDAADAVAAAKKAYDSLTPEQQAKISEKTLGKLTAAQNSVAKAEEQAKAAEKAAAEKAAIAKATPGKVTLVKKKTKSTKKGKVTVAWKKVANAAGYQVKVGKKAYTVKGAAKLKKTVKAKKGKKVKVQVRAFSTYNGKTLYGPWSAAKKVKVKK